MKRFITRNLKMAKFIGWGSTTLLLIIPVLLSASLFLYISTHRQSQSQTETIRMAATISEKFGVKIERNPPQSKLTDLGVSSWPKWGCSPSKFPWTFTAKETMYLLEGKVKVYCDGHDEFFEIGAGDLVEFPKGMKVTWDVTEAVNKHYNLDK